MFGPEGERISEIDAIRAERLRFIALYLEKEFGITDRRAVTDERASATANFLLKKIKIFEGLTRNEIVYLITHPEQTRSHSSNSIERGTDSHGLSRTYMDISKAPNELFELTVEQLPSCCEARRVNHRKRKLSNPKGHFTSKTLETFLRDTNRHFAQQEKLTMGDMLATLDYIILTRNDLPTELDLYYNSDVRDRIIAKLQSAG